MIYAIFSSVKAMQCDAGAIEGLKIRAGDWSENMKDGKEFPHFYYVICRKLEGGGPPHAPPPL